MKTRIHWTDFFIPLRVQYFLSFEYVYLLNEFNRKTVFGVANTDFYITFYILFYFTSNGIRFTLTLERYINCNNENKLTIYFLCSLLCSFQRLCSCSIRLIGVAECLLFEEDAPEYGANHFSDSSESFKKSS